MANTILDQGGCTNLWPFRVDELRDSKQLVKKLSIPQDTKQFVFALRDPHTQSIIYILSSLNLSERSASDAMCLIKEIKPDAVLVQAAVSPFSELQSEEDSVPVPTSSFGVIKRCFLDKIGRDMYESVACNFVLREIFGTSFHGPLLAAKRAAEDVGSSFLHAASWAPSALKRFSLDKELRMMLAKALSGSLDPLLLSSGANAGSVLEKGNEEIQPSSSYETPGFARSIYALLEDLYSIFGDLPSLGKALAHVQKMLIAPNNKGLRPSNRKGAAKSDNIEFSEILADDKLHTLFAQAIRSQTDKFKTIVAVVDAIALAGLRKHWDTPLPVEVKELVGELITNSEVKGVMMNHSEKKWLLTDKPMVAVGAGATAVFGASSLTKVVPASTLVKVITFKIPTSLKISLSQMQKVLAFAFGHYKVVAPGIATSGAKTSGIMKAAVSAEKI
ncbi:uncharacterized protein [Glycine max]|uniref:uncharacterized protein n=1 Tax=Glycine max TaxID=3847 RepID=UPI0003DE8618|nr:uncharacterized protein LOC100790252 [Glycine max]|eukprot:XP_006593007.1 uncharacterized protein LOC100790252 [Glycine max]